MTYDRTPKFSRGASAKLPDSIKRVVFTCDFLRLGEVDGSLRVTQRGNLLWLKSLLCQSRAWRSPELQIQIVVPPDATEDVLETAMGDDSSWADFKREPELAWAARYDNDLPGCFPEVFEQLSNADLIVGFELPPTIKRFLTVRDRPYISFGIHPLRFLRDLCFGATTNCNDIAKQLGRCVVPDEEVIAQASRFRAAFTRTTSPALTLPEGVPLLVGQTERDSIVIEEGRFTDWPDFESELEDAIRGHETLVLVEHPLRLSSAAIANYVRARFDRNVVSTNANGYGLLFSNEKIDSVVTLSSSLGVEAAALGLSTRFLLGDPRVRVAVSHIDTGPTDPLGHAVLLDTFWSRVLRTESGPTRARPRAVANPFSLGDGYIRRGQFPWSYTLLESGPYAARSRKRLLPSSELSNAARATLLRQLMGVGSKGDCRSADPNEQSGTGAEVQVIEDDPPIGLAEQRTLRNATTSGRWGAISLVGFHEREEWGAWAASRESAIRIAVAREAAQCRASLNVLLDVAIYTPVLEACPVLGVFHKGACVAAAFYRPEGPNPEHVEVEVEVKFGETECMLELVFSDAIRPIDVDGAPDRRALGLGLRDVQVSCKELEARSGRRGGIGRMQLWGIRDTPVATSSTRPPETRQ